MDSWSCKVLKIRGHVHPKFFSVVTVTNSCGTNDLKTIQFKKADSFPYTKVQNISNDSFSVKVSMGNRNLKNIPLTISTKT